MAIKDDYIKIRVSKEQKELFKDIAKKKNISMSKFIIVSTEERALREKEKFEGTKSLELRVSELEKKKGRVYEQLMGELETAGIRIINFNNLGGVFYLWSSSSIFL